MTLNDIYTNHPKLSALISELQNQKKVKLTGLTGSSMAMLGGTVANNSKQIHVFVLPEKEEAAYFANDLLNLIDEKRIFFFPSSYKRPGQSNFTDPSSAIQRTELLNNINQKGLLPPIIVTYPEALSEKVVSQSKLVQNTINLRKGEKIDLAFLKETLKEYQFERSDFVYEPGQYSIRGSIVDVFSFAAKFPYRIDFFGEEVETIRSFEIDTQLSVDQLDKIQIVPDVKKFGLNEAKISLLEYLPDNSVLWFADLTYSVDRIQEMLISPWHHIEDKYNDSEVQLAPDLVDTGRFVESLKQHTIVECNNRSYLNINNIIEFNTTPQPVFNKNFELLAQHLHENCSNGFRNFICTENPKQVERLNDIFKSIDKEVVFEPLIVGVHSGFMDQELKICLYTDHQIFERYHKFKFKHNYTKSEALTISEISDLYPGDYVVHIDHGIGKFGGIEKVEINGRVQEVIKLVYRDNDVLYVGIHSLHRISKYKGKDGEPPKIYKLGTGAWQKLKATTKSKVKDIAKELIALYAKRKDSAGFKFNPDTYFQQELEASFIYEDTPDQEKATKLVKQGMESEYPMDMLVCGDVGFGKTEIAIRAAFKAATDGKQVAVLVPTTILALQHYKTFSDRLKEFPCNVEYISRMRKPKDVKETLDHVKNGKVDILIGTHKLLGKEVTFKDLGLLIIDEEQKFGVAMKEKLKKIKLDVDTLTLSATPIPRTLQFSLMGARDLAIINTPPPNRHPIATEVHVFNEDIIREGIMYEISRGGQVFFINNRIQNIYELQTTIDKIVPDAKTVVAHGQMDGDHLESIILGFINGDYDVLIATSIIESGLDIPNANTIFVNESHHFGLSDLHQLRGRVGRSNKKAFCYLLAPPLNVLTQEARRRLKAIEDFSDLGSGFNIAMQDLDIRGAGNLLGAEQSGFIAEIGYETYQRILNEAIQELKETEFKDVFYNTDNKDIADTKLQTNVLESSAFLSDCQIDTDLEIMLPENYVESITERIKLYRELDNIQDELSLKQFELKLIDRFGPLPESTTDLLDIVRLRWLSIKLGFERISLKNNRLTIYFISNQQSPYYQSPVFTNILQFIQKNPRVFQMKEGKDKLTMYTEGVGNVGYAIEILNKLKS